MTHTTATTQAPAKASPTIDYLANTRLSTHERQLGAAVISVQAVMVVEKDLQDFLAGWFAPYSPRRVQDKAHQSSSSNDKRFTAEQQDFMNSIKAAWNEISSLKSKCGFEVDTPTEKAVNSVAPEQRARQVSALNIARETIRDKLIEILTLSGHIFNDEQFDRAATPRFWQLGAPSPV